MNKLTLKKLLTYSLLAVIIFATKFAMSGLPNIEPVSVLLTAYTIVFGLESIYIAGLYILLDCILYGFGLWTAGYIYIWLVLILMVYFLCKKDDKLPCYVIINGIFGLIFGALFIPMYLTMGGIDLAVSWWISGLPYDIIHCIGNIVMCTLLLNPIRNALSKLKEKYLN